MEISLHHEYLPSLIGLTPEEQAQANRAIVRYQKSPNHPSLNLERLGGGSRRRRLCSIRASQELRILLARQGDVMVVLRAGHHDDIYRLANRNNFVVPPDGRPGLMRVLPEANAGRLPEADEDIVRPASEVRDESIATPTSTVPEPARDVPTILEHWSAAELAQAGFDQDEISKLRCATQDTLLDVWPDISDERFDFVVECMESTPEQLRQNRLFNDEQAEADRFRAAIVERGALGGLSLLLTAEEFERVMAAPIEEWMIFLHPDQRTLAERRFSGPARVRGAAGTGKTVVALHRSAVLANRYKADAAGKRPPVLFTTFISSLPPLLEDLYGRLPSRVEGGVHFVNVDRLAYELCGRAGQPPRIDPNAANKAFNSAFRAVVRPNTPLHGVAGPYLREELQAVLKGRGVASLAEYLNMERTGRRTRFTAPMREQAWALLEVWDKQLNEAGIEDFADVARRARDFARGREPMYRAAVIDEAQDVSLVQLQLVHALVSDRDGDMPADALFVVGDGAQKIYPGGFTLAQAGLDVRGNSAVLRVNYRNTQEIIAAAMAAAGAEPVNDLGDEFLRGEAETAPILTGNRPLLACRGEVDAQIDYVAEQARLLCENSALGLGDIAVLVATNKLERLAIDRLARSGIEAAALSRLNGSRSPLLKVGTFHRSKGLEFKVVFLLDISAGEFPSKPWHWRTQAEKDERRALEISQLFVAMTRARDRLFILCNQEPSEVLYDALDYLEVED